MKLCLHIFLGLTAFIGGALIFFHMNSVASWGVSHTAPSIQKEETPLTIKFFDERTFITAVQLHPKTSAPSKSFRGGIVPHHLLVSEEIARFFQRCSAEQPNIVIILGPNHSEQGDGTPLSTLKSWQYPFGQLHAERSLIAKLANQGLLRLSDRALEEDHSISSLLPFLHHYVPTARIVPILLSKKTTLKETQDISRALRVFLKENPKSILISSIDFSHGLGEAEGFQRDRRTQALIQAKDFTTIMSLDSTYLDSPASAVVLLQTMDALGNTQQELFFRGSSARKTGQPNTPGTTYFSMGWY